MKPPGMGKDSIALGSVYLYWPLAVKCGSATARVCTTTPCDASRSFCALRMVAFCWRATFRQSTSESGCEIHTVEFVSALCATAFLLAARHTSDSEKMILIFFIGKNVFDALRRKNASWPPAKNP